MDTERPFWVGLSLPAKKWSFEPPVLKHAEDFGFYDSSLMRVMDERQQKSIRGKLSVRQGPPD